MIESISLIIITYNRPDDLAELLQSLRVQQDISGLKEVLILNNASTVSYQRAEEFIRLHQDIPIRYMVSPENLGVSRGRNRLMNMASAELLLVLDDDILFDRDNSLATIAGILDKPFFKEANTGIVTFRVVYHATNELQLTAFPHKKFTLYKDQPVFLTYYFAGCAHLLKKELLAQTGVYPEDFFYGMEEYDLSYRVIKAGYTLGYDNSVTFLHKESPLGRQPNYQKLASQWVNKTKVAWRYLPGRYYFSTMLAWSFRYIGKAGGHWKTYFQSWGKAIRIPDVEKRNPLTPQALAYLKKVKARLWY